MKLPLFTPWKLRVVKTKIYLNIIYIKIGSLSLVAYVIALLNETSSLHSVETEGCYTKIYLNNIYEER